jgi:hypothetical protein
MDSISGPGDPAIARRRKPRGGKSDLDTQIGRAVKTQSSCDGYA